MQKTGIRKIDPKALESFVGDRVFLWFHKGRGKYSRFPGSLEYDKEGDFCIRDAEYREFSVPLKHGDGLDLQTQKGVCRSYVFIDDSD